MPIRIDAVRPNEPVEVQITEAAATRLVRELGTFASRLEGPLMREPGDSVSVGVLIAREYNGVQLEGARLPLFLSRTEVIEVRRRELSRSRTALASVGALLLFGVVAAHVTQEGDPNTPSDNPFPPPPAGLRIGVRLPRP